MSTLNIIKSIDIEDEVRIALKDYLTVYCQPLPAALAVPSVEVRKVGGGDRDTIDTATIMLYARATDEASADDYLRTAIGVLKAVCDKQTTALRFATVNTSGAWGTDPVRPDLALCTATLQVRAHQVKEEIS
jgi:hypothetical protein